MEQICEEMYLRLEEIEREAEKINNFIVLIVNKATN